VWLQCWLKFNKDAGGAEMLERGSSQIELCTLLENLPEAVFIVESGGRIIEANSPTERIVGLKPEQLRGMNLAELAKVVSIKEQGRALDTANLAISRALRGETLRNEHRVFEKSEDERLEALVSANPMRSADGNICGALVVVRDISELTQLQRRLADTERHRAIGHMAAGLVHDFNNVLDTLEKAVTLMQLKEQTSPEQRRPYIDIAHKAVRRGAEIVARLRQYLKNGTGEVTTMDTRQIVEESLELIQPMLQTAHQNVKVKRELNDAGVVRANAADLRRVMLNLMINALQAMPNGGELTVKTERNGGDGSRARVMVADTGVGIPKHQQKKVFFPYFTTKPNGTGLGLSGAQRILLSYHGSIHFWSEPGKGTRFTVELPIAQERKEPRAATSSRIAA
jgi:PAS domain S-box-containing protein